VRVYDDNKQYFQICYLKKNKFGSYNWRSICTAAQEFVVKKTKTKKRKLVLIVWLNLNFFWVD
jgi:hypothetical protein